MFVHRHEGITIIILLYVDDIILTGSCTKALDLFVKSLSAHFHMKDLGDLHYFLGIQVTRTSAGLLLSQSKYATDLLHRAQMGACKSAATPLATKVTNVADTPLSDVTGYRSIVGALQYLTLTRPDISFAVNSVCQYMHCPTVRHMHDVKRILRYVHGTVNQALQIKSNSSLDLFAFSDADWGGCPLTRRSTTGYCTFLAANLISWSAKKQPTVARSSTEA